MTKSAPHSQRKHSKFSASGSERWFNCPGSVELSEGVPDKETPWAKEGTLAHEVLEQILLSKIQKNAWGKGYSLNSNATKEMLILGERAARFIYKLHKEAPGSELMAEMRVTLSFIHEDAFGTFDAAVVDHFGVLHVFDYKFGSGHAVSPGSITNPNLQLVFYGLGLAHEYDWNFKSVRLWIIQPRIKGFTGPVFLEMPIIELKRFAPKFKKAVTQVLTNPDKYAEGPWCHWCKGKTKCPLKTKAKTEQAQLAFLNTPVE